jgi:hypothetical protein
MTGSEKSKNTAKILDQHLKECHWGNAVRDCPEPHALSRRSVANPHIVATAKPMLPPTAHQLKERAEEARVIGELMRDPDARRIMMNLALSYERLAKQAQMRDEGRENSNRAAKNLDRFR